MNFIFGNVPGNTQDVRVTINAAVRLLLILTLCAFAASGLLSWPLALAWTVLILSIRVFKPLSTLNLIALYWFITFVLVPPVNVPSMAAELRVHYVLIQGAITLTYWARRLTRPRSPKPVAEASPVTQARFRTIWYAAVAIGVVSVVTQIALAGPAAWFSGSVLAQQMEGYATGSVVEAFTRLLGWITNWTLLALFIFHRVHRIPMHPLSASAPLLGLPILALSRQTLFYNTLFLIFTARFRLTTILLAVGVVAAALYIGFLRATHLVALDPEMAIGRLFASEFSSNIPYTDLIRYGSEIGFQWGVPIVVPVLLAIVPRFAFPDKPLNGSGVYMQHFEPDLLERGYTYAINPMSDAYLSFGFWGVAAVAILIGWLFSGVDRKIERGELRVFEYLLIFNCYSIMRYAIAAPVTWILIQLALYWIVSRLILFSAPGVRGPAAAAVIAPPDRGRR